MSLSANTGICDDLRTGEYEPEREHWYLRRSESKPQGNAGICEDLTWRTRENTGGDRGATFRRRASKSLFSYRQDPYSLRCLGNKQKQNKKRQQNKTVVQQVLLHHISGSERQCPAEKVKVAYIRFICLMLFVIFGRGGGVVCDDLRAGEYEPEREHWYLRGSESRGI